MANMLYDCCDMNESLMAIPWPLFDGLDEATEQIAADNEHMPKAFYIFVYNVTILPRSLLRVCSI